MKLFKRITTTALAAITLTLSAISTTSAADWRYGYRNQLTYMNQHPSLYNSYDNNLKKSTLKYTLYDIDKDGIKELIVKTGTCEGDYEYLFYTFSNGKTVSMGSKDGLHTTLGACSDNGVLLYSGMQQYEYEYKVTKKGNTLYTNEVFSRYSEVYHSPSSPLTFINTTDFSYIS